MTTITNSYIPSDVYQPRGKHPWCANCDTDLHLMVESPAITGKQAGSLAVAVHCSQCRTSRVLDTTPDHVAALPALVPQQQDFTDSTGNRAMTQSSKAPGRTESRITSDH